MNISDIEPAEFSQLINTHSDQLTNSQKRIADYMIQNQDEVGFMSAAEIAHTLNLSEPTMVRFARALGFDSYPAMRVMLQAKVRKLVNHSARIRSLLDELRVNGDIHEQLVASEIYFLTESIHTLDKNAYDKAVELLHAHQRIFVFGIGPSVSLVDLLEIRLTRAARYVIPLRTSGRELLEPLLLMNKNDLLIAIGFHSVTPYLQLVLKRANEKNMPIIFITDTLGELVGNMVTVTLSARRGPVSAFHSLTVPMTIINSLFLSLTAVENKKIMNTLDELDQFARFVRENDEGKNLGQKERGANAWLLK